MKRRRSSEGGAIAIVVAFSLILLFGVAALAVDAGFAYTRRMGLQSAADAAALAGAMGGLSTTNATTVATANTYTTGGGTTVTATPSGNQMQVTIAITQPSLFAAALGYGASRILSATATAVMIPAVPAVMALTTDCMDSGVQFRGGPITIGGNIASGGTVDLGTATSVVGSVAYRGPCGFTTGGSSSASKGIAPGTGTNPFASTTIASFTTCDFGTLSTGPLNVWPIVNGVYCSGTDLNINLTPAVNVNITMVAKGQINISGNGGILTARTGGFVAFSNSALDCPASQAINIGNSSVTMNGSFYAPNGCVNFSGNTMIVNGSLVGMNVQIQAGASSAVNGPSASSSGSSYLLN